ncbi:DUF3025 domain-containing protein [Undibacterium terreum]|uniref:DUF3025 domain-containing protein n=1 Tax=Undibacterium terreum TaxID=1224302 RepID=A0A916UPB6_9BURK|nr:DUF3025 domain-containing protein [Undibacterium terreum]GGC80067.1 hypothetical protein GCM10011396_29200 [Undibacterium terreum]
MFFDCIDWTRAWYASVLPLATEIGGAPSVDANADVDVVAYAGWRGKINAYAAQAALRNHRQQALRFVTQEELPEGMAYEAYISDTGHIPTRENLHDFFNALVWLNFPMIKMQLNALQSAQIASLGVGKSRGAARDAATIFDENAALLVIRHSDEGAALLDALQNHRWQQAFVEQRHLFGTHCEVWSFGHALMEKLVQPYKAITAHAWPVIVEANYFDLDVHARRAYLDRKVAQQLKGHALTTADYTPLPVLGIPGWWPDQNEEFYADTQVFRPKRLARD